MNIYDEIKLRFDAGEESVPVTSLVYGRGLAVNKPQPGYENYPLVVLFDEKVIKRFTVDGKYFHSDKFPQLAIGHHEGQVMAAKAIDYQGFDVEEE